MKSQYNFIKNQYKFYTKIIISQKSAIINKNSTGINSKK